MRTLCGFAILFRTASRSRFPQGNLLFSSRQVQFYRWSRPSIQKAGYSGRTARHVRASARPNSFDKHGSSEFKKAQHESMYLYKALSNTTYVFGCYFSGVLMIAAGIFNHSTIAWANEKGMEEKQPLPSFIPAFTFVGSLFIVGTGCYFIFAKSRNLCQSIRSLPVKRQGGNNGLLLLEIERARWLPFTRPATLRFAPEDLNLIGSLKAEQRLRIQNIPPANVAAFSPFELLQGAIRGIFRAVTNSGFLKLQVKGYFYAWKIDSRLAWAFEEGEALESLVRVTKSDQR